MYQEKFTELGPYVNLMHMHFVPRHKISYLEFGSKDKPVVICAHGLTRNAYDFKKIASALSKNYRVIAISYAGRGNSDWLKNKNHYNYTVYVKDSLQLLKKLSITRPFWLGTSMGGIIGMIMAAKYRDIFAGLILNDIGPSMPISTVNKISNYARQINYFENLEQAKSYLKLIYSGFGIKDENDWDDITRHSFIQNKAGKYLMNYDPEIVRGVEFRIPKKLQDIAVWNLWHKIKCKLLLIHGVKSNILLPDTVKKMQDTKKIDLYTINDAGHAPALLEKEQIDFVKNWIDNNAD